MALLEGVTVVEIGNGVPAGYCGRVLGSLGAAVIRIELADDLDPVRAYGSECPAHPPLSCTYCHLNGAKARVLLRGGPEQAFETFLPRLLRAADLAILGDGLLAGATAGRLQRGDLTGPDAVRIVGSPIDDAMPPDESTGVAAGLRDLYGDETPPEGARLDLAEINAGLHAAAVASLALVRQDRDPGKPMLVEVGVFEAAFSIIEIAAQTLLLAEQFEAGFPNMISSPLGRPYRARDGRPLVINAYGKEIWSRLCAAMERPDLREDVRFQDAFLMYLHADDLRALLDGWCAARDRDGLLERLHGQHIPAAPVFTLAELVADRHIEDRGMFIADPETGVRHVGSAYLVDGERSPLLHQRAEQAGALLEALGVQTPVICLAEVDHDAVVIDVL